MNEQSLTKESLLAYRARYEAVAAIRQIELQQMTIEQRWQKLNLLLCSAVAFGWFPKMQEHRQDVETVRARWLKLKAAYQ